MVIVDTNIIIDHVRQKQNHDTVFLQIAEQYGNDNLAISVVSVQELYAGKSTRKDKEERLLLTIILSMRILPYSFQVAQTAGKLVRDLGRQIEFPDAAIAATAILNGGKLVTLNKKDFKGINNLELIA